MEIKSQLTKRPMFGLVLLGVVFLACVGIFLGFGANAKENGPPEQIIRPVKVINLTEATIKETRSFPGLVNGRVWTPQLKKSRIS